jgi:tRNA/tmRNA/rRNA uracil-C5-methylase (TrmA/RlmC/RlmD family)
MVCMDCIRSGMHGRFLEACRQADPPIVQVALQAATVASEAYVLCITYRVEGLDLNP